MVLAHGNQRPAPLTVDDGPLPEARWHLPDPWDLDRLTALAPDAVVVLVGTGLTAVDAAITLLDDAPDRRVVMVSRHGLLPAAHVEQSSTAWLSPVPTGPVTADQLAELLRDQVAAARRQGVDWRPVVDGLRAPTQGLWQRLDLAERRRFLATYAREWEVRRHRMAPEVAGRLDGYRDEGRLKVLDGGVASVTDHGPRCEVELPGAARHPLRRRRGQLHRPDDRRLPQHRPAAAGAGRPRHASSRTRSGSASPARPSGEVLDVSGQVVPGLYVVGPPRKGTLWETTAVPEIRGQAAALAQRAARAGAAPPARMIR